MSEPTPLPIDDDNVESALKVIRHLVEADAALGAARRLLDIATTTTREYEALAARVAPYIPDGERARFKERAESIVYGNTLNMDRIVEGLPSLGDTDRRSDQSVPKVRPWLSDHECTEETT